MCNVHAHDVPFARGASPTEARLRLSSANEFRFSAVVGCHVKLHRRAFFFHTATCTHVAIEGARAEGSNTESSMSGMSRPHVYSRALAIVAGDR